MNAEDRCFAELAPLYALDLLDEADRQFVEEQIADCPELAEELTELQATVGAIPYSTPVIPMADNLKDRLFQRLGYATPEPAVPVSSGRLPEVVVRSQDLDWKPYRIPGVRVARLHRDPVRREVSALLRAEAGVCYPMHCHASFEEIYLLEGDLIIGEQVYRAGDYIRSEQGSLHSPSTRTGCMFFVRTSLDDEYLDE
jgi:anti-sigma factor ChrR (cupin superfamily)